MKTYSKFVYLDHRDHAELNAMSSNVPLVHEIDKHESLVSRKLLYQLNKKEFFLCIQINVFLSTNRNHIEYLILIQAIIESNQMMHRNEHHRYSSFDIHDLCTTNSKMKYSKYGENQPSKYPNRPHFLT